MNTLTNSEQIRPNNAQRFLLWIAIAAIVMTFAGLTSAYLVKQANSNWLEFSLPKMFWYSTGVIILSSISMHFALKAYKQKNKQQYRILISVTGLLGLLFCYLQFLGYTELTEKGIQIIGSGSNPSASFLGVISGLHVLHVLGGIVALLILIIKSFNSKIKMYQNILVENVATYWHFVDILWIYLLVFFTIAK